MLRKYYFLPHLIILISGLIIGSFFDFEINNAIFSERNSFGIFMAAFGEYPVYLLNICIQRLRFILVRNIENGLKVFEKAKINQAKYLYIKK